MNLTVNNITQEREKTHGSFETNALICSEIKRIFHYQDSWILMSHVEREAFDMIAMKMARALSKPKANSDDWLDIAGYASLVYDYLEKKKNG